MTTKIKGGIGALSDHLKKLYLDASGEIRYRAKVDKILVENAKVTGVQLKDVEHLILVDAKAPVSFFAYPGKKSCLVPDSCTVHTLSSPEQDAAGSLRKL